MAAISERQDVGGGSPGGVRCESAVSIREWCLPCILGIWNIYLWEIPNLHLGDLFMFTCFLWDFYCSELRWSHTAVDLCCCIDIDVSIHIISVNVIPVVRPSKSLAWIPQSSSTRSNSHLCIYNHCTNHQSTKGNCPAISRHVNNPLASQEVMAKVQDEDRREFARRWVTMQWATDLFPTK